MSANTPTDEQIQLIDAYLLGKPSPEQVAELERAVMADAAIRDLYWQRLRWHTLLREFCERRPMAQLAAQLANSGAPFPHFEELLKQLEASPANAPAPPADRPAPLETPAGQPPPASPVLGFLGGVVDYVSGSRRLMLGLLVGVLTVYGVVRVGGLLVKRFSGQDQVASKDGADANPHEGVAAPAIHPVQAVARLTSAIDCKWDFAPESGAARRGLTTLPLGEPLYPAQKLDLVAGLAEITFTSGAKAILQAPTRFSVSHALGGDLQLGRLTVKAPGSAKGFSVNTPSGKVVDLGTEFGVKVGEDRATHVTVFVGEVIVKSQAARGGQPAEPMHVKAGEAVVMATGQPAHSVAVQNDQFVRDLTAVAEQPEIEAEYLDFMQSLKPAVWFRMQGSETDRVVHDTMAAARDGQLHWDGPGNPFVKGPLGKGLWLRGPKFGDYVAVPDYPKAANRRITVSAWVRADSRPNGATIAANWRQRFAVGQFQFGLLSDDESSPAVDLGVRISPRDGPGIFTLGEGKANPFPLGEWQHVAFVVDGGSLRLYRQGREVAVNNHVSFKHPGPVKSLAIGCTFDDSDQAPGGNPGWWDGKIAELTIFNDALSADDIARLAAFGSR